MGLSLRKVMCLDVSVLYVGVGRLVDVFIPASFKMMLWHIVFKIFTLLQKKKQNN